MSPTTATLEHMVQTLKRLAEPTRMRLVTLLGHGELTVGEMCRVVGQSQPRVSRHLRLLTEAGLLDRFREQQRVYYRRPTGALKGGWLHDLLACMDPGDPAVQRDRAILEMVVGDRKRSAMDKLGPGEPAQGEEAALAEVLRAELGPGSLGELLDIGTGAGRVLETLASQASKAVGVDQSSSALRLARARLHGRDLAHCEFKLCDMHELSFAADSFDTITIVRVLAAAKQPIAVLSEACRLLRRNGRVLLIERLEAIEASTGLDSVLGMRQWLGAAGLVPTRLRRCDVDSGQYLLALAQRA